MKIRDLEVLDVRFPTSEAAAGSDAMHPDPDYSAAYVVLHTDDPDGQRGHGLAFTLGRGTEVCAAALRALAPLVVGQELERITTDFGAFWHRLANDGQLRWLGPQKGAVHLALGAVVNALWDLWARVEGKPLWRLVHDLEPAEVVRCLDLSYCSDFLRPEEARELLEQRREGRGARLDALRAHGYPAYTTSAGWIGYDDERLRRHVRAALEDGWSVLKIKVGADPDDDRRRAAIVRDEIGAERLLMLDANQRWDVGQAIDRVRALAELAPTWIEEPTSPDDVLGHRAIAEAVAPIGVAPGEAVHNRIVFKQLFQAEAIDYCQVDACRLGGVNEVLAVLLMAAKAGVPVCPHAGGVGLCEHVQHLAAIDFLSVSGGLAGRVCEYVDDLHEHFVHPCTVELGHYRLPADAGYSTEMRPESLAAFRFPDGPQWQRRLAGGGGQR